MLLNEFGVFEQKESWDGLEFGTGKLLFLTALRAHAVDCLLAYTRCIPRSARVNDARSN